MKITRFPVNVLCMLGLGCVSVGITTFGNVAKTPANIYDEVLCNNS